MMRFRPLMVAAALSVGLGLPLATLAQNSAALPCKRLSDPQGWTVAVFKPGNYCLNHDLKQSVMPAWMRLPHQAVPMGPLIDIDDVGNVSIDLASHRLSTNRDTGFGVYHLGGSGLPNKPIAPHRFISLANGSIRTTVQPAVMIIYSFNVENTRFYHKDIGKKSLRVPELSNAHGDLGRYLPTDYVLENLTLTSDQVVIVMQGKHNIIRHCKIIGSNAAVNLYGPNLVFEDNEIIMEARDPTDAGGEPQVALYVEDGADSVIRNNRFVIKGRPNAATAIMFKNSERVVMEGNTVAGKATLFQKLDDKSTVELK